MGSFLAQAAPVANNTERTRTFYTPNPSTVADVDQPEYNQATFSYNAPVDTSGSFNAQRHVGDPGDVIFEKVYVLPTEIDAGFIIEDSEYDIQVWNSSYESQATITSIQKVNDEGTTLVHPTVPIVLERNSDQIHDLTILLEGPAIQNTVFIYTVDAQAYTVDVTGKRVEFWPFEINWAIKPKMKYNLATVIYRTQRFTEQRRRLTQKVMREQAVTYLFSGLEEQRFLNELRRLSTKIIAVPVYGEPILPSEDLLGETTIDTSTDLQYLYNLNNLSQFILLKERGNNVLAEIKEIDSVGANSITVTNAVIEDFKQADTLIFPLFVGIIKSKNPNILTTRAAGANVEFKEVFV